MNDFRMRPTPGHFTPTEINELVEPQGPLTRLLGGLGLDDKLPAIKPIPRIDTMPVAVSIPVSTSTPDDRVCPCCRIFEIEAGTDRCPRCNRKAGIRAVKADELARHYESVDREIRTRSTGLGHPFEQPELEDVPRVDDPDGDELR